jgi:hypothetical protein
MKLKMLFIVISILVIVGFIVVFKEYSTNVKDNKNLNPQPQVINTTPDRTKTNASYIFGNIKLSNTITDVADLHHQISVLIKEKDATGDYYAIECTDTCKYNDDNSDNVIKFVSTQDNISTYSYNIGIVMEGQVKLLEPGKSYTVKVMARSYTGDEIGATGSGEAVYTVNIQKNGGNKQDLEVTTQK